MATFSNYSGYNPQTGSYSYNIGSTYYQYQNNALQFINYANPGGSWSAAPTGSTGSPAAPTAPKPDAPADPFAKFMDDWRREQAAVLERQRSSAFDQLNSVFAAYGIDMDGTGLAALVKSWVYQDKSAAWIGLEIRNTTAYQNRFPGMKALIAKGQAMTEAEYIAQERAYRGVLQSYGLPTGFYDDPSDYGKFIANGVSVKELEDRVVSAKTFLDSRDPAYKTALSSLYGIGEGDMLAYVLDGDRAQALITQRMKSAAFAGAAASKGDFALTVDQAEKYGATLGRNYDAIGADQVNALEKSLSELGQLADQDQKLSTIDNETFTRTDTLDAALLNDNDKKAASQRRAEREKNRFAGSSAITQGSLSRRGGA